MFLGDATVVASVVASVCRVTGGSGVTWLNHQQHQLNSSFSLIQNLNFLIILLVFKLNPTLMKDYSTKKVTACGACAFPFKGSRNRVAYHWH